MTVNDGMRGTYDAAEKMKFRSLKALRVGMRSRAEVKTGNLFCITKECRMFGYSQILKNWVDKKRKLFYSISFVSYGFEG